MLSFVAIDFETSVKHQFVLSALQPQKTAKIIEEFYSLIKPPNSESFDRSVLQKSMIDNGLDYSELNISDTWECTMKYCKSISKYPSAELNECCIVEGIELNHHNTLSDARACAELFLSKQEILDNVKKF